MQAQQQFEIIAAGDADITAKINALTNHKGILTADSQAETVGVKGYANLFGGSINDKAIMGTQMWSETPGLMDVEKYVKRTLGSCDYAWVKQNQSGKTIVINGDEGRSLTLKSIN